MQARQKPLNVIEVDENNINTETIKFFTSLRKRRNKND